MMALQPKRALGNFNTTNSKAGNPTEAMAVWVWHQVTGCVCFDVLWWTILPTASQLWRGRGHVLDGLRHFTHYQVFPVIWFRLKMRILVKGEDEPCEMMTISAAAAGGCIETTATVVENLMIFSCLN